jgi:hypothetical protein
MENILEPNNHFDFSKLSLAQPIGINGGAYFTKFLYNTQPFYIETPKCLTKQGFIKHGKKIYTELMFDNSDSHFIHWIENLETTCHKLIYENSESWFKDKLELNDIESAFTASLKTYRSGKYYLLRVYGKINNLTNNPNVKIYNENETLLTTEDIKLDTNIISIIELQGIKFTNKSFQIEFEIKQMMVLIVDKLFESCVIKKHKNVSMQQQQQQQHQQQQQQQHDQGARLLHLIRECENQPQTRGLMRLIASIETAPNNERVLQRRLDQLNRILQTRRQTDRRDPRRSTSVTYSRQIRNLRCRTARVRRALHAYLSRLRDQVIDRLRELREQLRAIRRPPPPHDMKGGKSKTKSKNKHMKRNKTIKRR